jgi:serine/threonine protein phosphatase PrpC
MGNCLGRPELEDNGSKKSGLRPASKCVFDKDFLQLHVDNSVTAGASSAHFAASAAQNTFSSIHKCSENVILIGLVEGVACGEPARALTAAFIDKHLFQTFLDTCSHYGGLDQHNNEDILCAVLQSLHHRCLASPNLSKNSNSCGASATLALINLSTHSCTVANVGNSRCLIAGVSGSFNSKRPHCTWASSLHTTENQKERIHADRHKNINSLIPLSARRNDTAQPVFLTRALGMVNNGGNGSFSNKIGSHKAPNSSNSTRTTPTRTTSFKNKFDVEVDVNTFQLTPTEGHIIIGSSGFWELVAPPAVALRAHLFCKVS